MADFEERLWVKCTDKCIGMYMCTWAQYDLSKEQDEPVATENKFNLSLGEACREIDHFASGNLLTRKAKLLRFMASDEYYDSEEY